MEANFCNRQNKVTISVNGSYAFIVICLNERIIDNNYGFRNEKYPIQYYQYDYNEICAELNKIDLNDLIQHTEKYLDY